MCRVSNGGGADAEKLPSVLVLIPQITQSNAYK